MPLHIYPTCGAMARGQWDKYEVALDELYNEYTTVVSSDNWRLH